MAKSIVVFLFPFLALVATVVNSRPSLHLDVDQIWHDAQLTEALEDFLSLISKHKVVIVGRSGDRFTDLVKHTFEELHEPPMFVDLTELDPEDEGLLVSALKNWLGYWITPRVFLNGKHYGGAELVLDNYQTGLLEKDLKGIETEL